MNKRASFYDPDEIHTASQDDHGHSAHLRVHVPKSWAALLQFVADSPSWPEFRSNQDIIRDAIFHRLHWIEAQKDREQFPYVQEALARERLLARLRIEEADADHREEMLARIERSLSRNLVEGDVDAARKTVEEAEGLMASLPHPFATRFAEQLVEWRQQVDQWH